MGLPIGGGFDFFIAGSFSPTYQMRVDDLDKRCRKAFVSITYPDRSVRQHSVIAGDIALHIFYESEAPLDIQLQRIKTGERGDLIADFKFHCRGVYEWRKTEQPGLEAR